MEPYYVYILRCRDGSLYTGITNDVAHRMAAHLGGKGAKYTRSHPPEAMAALWHCEDKTAAARLEYAVKAKLTRAQKLELVAAPERVGEWFPELPGEYAAMEPPVLG